MIKLCGETPEFSIENPKALLKEMLSQSGLSLAKAVNKMAENHPELKTSTQNISNKLSRNSINFSEMVALAEACGFYISFTTTADEIIVQPPTNKIEQHFNTTFDEKMVEGISSYVSEHMKTVIVAGRNADAAVSWIQTFCDEHKDEIQTLIDETMLLTTIQEKFDVQCKPTFKKPIKE